MNTYHAAHSSDISYSLSEENIVTESPTNQGPSSVVSIGQQRGIGQQRSPDSWTWEEILDGKGPWAQAGEYRRPKAELKAAKAEQRRYEEAARQRDRHAQTFFWGEAHREWCRVRLET
jgi:hypothetical protein